MVRDITREQGKKYVEREREKGGGGFEVEEVKGAKGIRERIG